MALEITAQNDAKLIISGTTTELATIYARIEFACPKNGETMQGALYNYATKSEYDTSPNALLRLDAFQTSYAITIDVATQQRRARRRLWTASCRNRWYLWWERDRSYCR